MKSILLSLMMLTGIASSAQSDKYVEAMKKNLVLFDSAKTSADYQAVANTFETDRRCRKGPVVAIIIMRDWHSPQVAGTIRMLTRMLTAPASIHYVIRPLPWITIQKFMLCGICRLPNR